MVLFGIVPETRFLFYTSSLLHSGTVTAERHKGTHEESVQTEDSRLLNFYYPAPA